MNDLFILTTLLFVVWSIRNILFWVSLWQLKEYRFDRIFVHLAETRQGKLLLFSPFSLLKWIGLFGYFYVIFHEDLLLWYQFFVAAIYIAELSFVSRELIMKLAKWPVFTAKAVFIAVTTALAVMLLYVLPLMEPFFWLLVIDRITVLIIAFFVFCLSFPTEIQRDMRIQQAAQKLTGIRKDKSHPIKVIGVTGSYGKSSTKEYIAQILNYDFSVVKTQGTNNTPIGIAQTILQSLTRKTDIFVVEMGAYKIGEIAEMCTIVEPQIGVLTAINDQHLSLFGSLQNTITAKYELIASLPKNGLALFNGNNHNTYELAKKTKKPYVLYAARDTEGKFPPFFSSDERVDIWAEEIFVEKAGIRFTVKTTQKTLRLSTPLLGAHTIENILPGIYLALHFGMRTEHIKKALRSLVPIEKTMIKKEWKTGITLIDDTFNANPQAAIAAAQYIQVYSGKKFYILQPMIELGSKAYDEHYRIAKEILATCDYFLLTNKNFADAIKKAREETTSFCNIKTDNATNLAKFIIENAKRGDVLAFEGKEAAFVMQKVINAA